MIDSREPPFYKSCDLKRVFSAVSGLVQNLGSGLEYGLNFELSFGIIQSFIMTENHHQEQQKPVKCKLIKLS